MFIRRLAQVVALCGALVTPVVTTTPASAQQPSTHNSHATKPKAAKGTSKPKATKHEGVVLDSTHVCSPGSVVAYAARGSGEGDGVGQPNGALISLLQRSHVFAHMTVFSDDYPAVPWYDYIRSSGSYLKSVKLGTDLGVLEVESYMKRCPQSVFFLLGYSQGADVIRNVVWQLNYAEQQRIGQVVLFGDPHFSPVEPGVLKYGSYENAGSTGPFGALGFSTRYIGIPTPHVLSVCDFGDPVCQTLGGVININVLAPDNPHYLYGAHAVDAGRIAARNLLSAGAAPAAPPPPAGGTPVATAPTPAHCAGYCVHGSSGTLTSRVAADASSAPAGYHAEGSLLSITCQSRGSAVGGSTVWDQLADSTWVPDYYTTTPNYNAFSPPLPQCGGAVTAPAPVTSPVPTGAYRYAVKGTGGIGLHSRNAPSISGTLITSYAEGASIDIACQVRSDSKVQGSTIWDQLADSSWVSDYFTSTPVFNGFSPPIPQCATTPPTNPIVPPPVGTSGGQTTYRYAVAGTGGIGLTERQGPSPAGPPLTVDPEGAPIDIVCQDHGDVVRGSGIWDKLADGNWISDFFTTTPVFNGFSPPIPQCPAPVTPPPATGVDREAVTSYDQMRGGAPYNGYFVSAWQGFTAQSNTLTHIGVTVGNTNVAAGSTSSTTVNIKLCLETSCAHVLASVNPQIVNFGNTYADIGDVPVTPGATYYVVYYQPAATAGTTWVTYWWSGGPGIVQSDQMQAVVKGFNQ
jgi:hypothetical protein